jgi:microsomal dipeptidase-like Zn-dependent dipeptidase
MKKQALVPAIALMVASTCGALAAQVLQTVPPPNSTMTAPGPRRQQPAGGQRPQTANPGVATAPSPVVARVAAQGTIVGYVYWDTKSVTHTPANNCNGLGAAVSVGTPPQGSSTFEQFKLLGTYHNFTYMGNVGSLAVCQYSVQQVPTGQDLQVQINYKQPSFTPAVLPTMPPTANNPNSPINISGGACNKLPPSVPSASVLGSGWWTCGNNAYNVNFVLQPATAGNMTGGAGQASLLSGAPQGANTGQSSAGLLGNSNQSRGMLLSARSPAPAATPTQMGTPTGAVPGQAAPAPMAASSSNQSRGMLMPAVTAAPAVTPTQTATPAGGMPGQTTPTPIAALNPKTGKSGVPVTAQAMPNQVIRANVLKGFVDLHAHPLSNLAFGGKLIYGGVDVGALLPADPNCNHNVRATSMQQALGHDNSTHGGWGTDNGCGDDIRTQVIHALQQANKASDPPDDSYGAPNFPQWPLWKDITHQKMWVDWIYRAYTGGLRVMVALAVNNKTLGDATAGTGDYATDDKSSGDLQIREIKSFVGRHSNFMEVAYSSADVARIVKADKLAVVVGVEIDNIGNLNQVKTLDANAVNAEIDRLYQEGVRYIFPIHVIDNPFGGTAVYEGAFNMSNYHITGNFWNLECANPADGINYRYQPDGFDVAVALVKATKLGIDAFRNPPDPPTCPAGDENSKGLTRMGSYAIRQMMRHGMLIDIDHMSQKSANEALSIAEMIPGGGYPLFSGHNTPRGSGGDSENQRTPQQYGRIAKLGGMAGVGTAGRDAYTWLQLYGMVVQQMHQQSEALGTDLNGLVKGMPPRRGSQISYSPFFPKSSLGARQWDYNRDGVPHYGMIPEFLMDAKTGTNGTYLIDKNLMYGAETFFEAWQKCENQKGNVN